MTTITEDYVSFEIAKLLKEKKFDEKCRTYYKVFPKDRIAAIYHSSEDRGVSEDDPNEILCPTLQMAMKWLREIHHIHIRLINSSDESYRYEIYPREGKNRSSCFSDRRYYETYEKAAEAAIKYCIENLIQK